MNWYSQFKEASGQFKISYISKQLIPYFVSMIKSHWRQGEFNFRDDSFIKLYDFLGLEKYKPTKDSPYVKLYNNPDVQVSVIFVCSIRPTDKVTSEVMANVKEVTSIGEPIVINVILLINRKEYDGIVNFTNENPVRTFEERFNNVKTGDVSSKIEHEIVHAVRNLLGYKTVDKDIHGNEKPYALPNGTEEGFRKYISQGPEAEEMYVVIHNDLLHCANEGEAFCQSAFSLTYKIYSALKIEAKGVTKLEAEKMTRDEVVSENGIRIEKLRKFKERIVGLLNKIDDEILQDKIIQYNWKNVLRKKMVRIINDDLEISE